MRGTLVAGEPLCLQFINTLEWRTGPHPKERLHSMADLLSWGASVGAVPDSEASRLARVATAHPKRAAAAFEHAIALREALYGLFLAMLHGTAPQPANLELVNYALEQALGMLRLRPEGGAFNWAWAAAGGELRRVLWPVLRSAAELLTSERLARVRQCADADCGWLFLDESRNRSRRWCNMADCGNRAKARRHYCRLQAKKELKEDIRDSLLALEEYRTVGGRDNSSLPDESE